MSNMSYCRFQNTLSDLYDCYTALGDIYSLKDLSKEEEEAARKLIKLCEKIVADWS